MPRPVTNKAQFVRLYQQGEFGNRSPTWGAIPDLLRCQSREGSQFHLRSRITGGLTYYGLTWVDALYKWRMQDNPRNWYVSEMAPHHLGTIQGEVRESPNFVDLTVTTGKLPMREALLTDYTTHLTGLRAIMVLRYHMNHKSYEWLQWLFEGYPNHTVEFTCFSKCWGTEPGYNTVFWEVRGLY